jgi:hypothetical protein
MAKANEVAISITLSCIMTMRASVYLQVRSFSITLEIPSSIHFFLICSSESLLGVPKETWLRFHAQILTYGVLNAECKCNPHDSIVRFERNGDQNNYAN